MKVVSHPVAARIHVIVIPNRQAASRHILWSAVSDIVAPAIVDVVDVPHRLA